MDICDPHRALIVFQKPKRMLEGDLEQIYVKLNPLSHGGRPFWPYTS